MKVFYHADNDGKCAGYWVGELAHPDIYETEFIKINHGMEFPFEEIKKDEYVYIVDYSISPEEMNRLLLITENVTWIDHHVSAIARYDGYDKDIRGIRYDGIAGCMLTYCYLKHMTSGGCGTIKPFNVDMCADAPMFTKLIADYDVWSFEYGEDTRAFQKGFELYLHEPNDCVWDNLTGMWSQRFLDDIISKGRTIINYRKNWMKGYCELRGFECAFENYNCFAVNMANISSDDFVGIDTDKYDMLIGFSYNGESWNYSLRSAKVDCSKVAMLYGGGGHKGAAGFNSDKLLLKAKTKE